MKKLFMILTVALSALYLIYPSLGIFEFIPDSIPVIGHLDEATAMMILLWALNYFGIDPTEWFKHDKKKPDELRENS